MLIRQHGGEAEVMAARRTDQMLECRDWEGRVVWVLIRQAIAELQAPAAGKPN